MVDTNRKIVQSAKESKCSQHKSIVANFFSSLPFAPFIFSKKIESYPGMFCTHNLSLLRMFQKAHNMPSDMLRGIHNMFKTCITWTQNVFRNHKAKTNKAKAKGQTGGKNYCSSFCTNCIYFLWPI